MTVFLRTFDRWCRLTCFFFPWSRVGTETRLSKRICQLLFNFLFNTDMSWVYGIIRRGRYIWWIYNFQRVIGYSLLQVAASGGDLGFEFILFSIISILYFLCYSPTSFFSTILLVFILSIFVLFLYSASFPSGCLNFVTSLSSWCFGKQLFFIICCNE